MNYTKEYFDYNLDRNNTRSSKWDGCNAKFGVDQSVDLIPMWIADMDFRAPKEVIDIIIERAQSGAYGYTTIPTSFRESIESWMKKRYNWTIEKDWIVFTPGVVPGFTVAYQYLTNPGEGIIVQQPVYYPFMDCVINNDRKLVVNNLINTDGYYTIDFEDLEEKVKDPNNKLLILSSPHNPVGRAWNLEELEKIGNLCADNGVILISDEIHADLMMKGHKHHSISSISDKIKNNTITFNAPSKTFNLAALQTSYAIIPNEEIRKKFISGITSNRTVNMNWFGSSALETAYNECEGYVDALCEYVNSNMDYMQEYLKSNIPVLKMRKSEATYMVWVDFRGTGMSTDEIEHFIIHKAKIAVDMGTWFGNGGDGYLRFNLACPRTILTKALTNLKDALEI